MEEKKIYLAVDEDGKENVFSHSERPVRMTKDIYPGWINTEYWEGDDEIELPPGTIEKLIGRKLTWDDEPVEYTGKEEEE